MLICHFWKMSDTLHVEIAYLIPVIWCDRVTIVQVYS